MLLTQRPGPLDFDTVRTSVVGCQLTTLVAMKESTEARTAPLGLRIRPSLKAALSRLADDDGRTLANYVERVLEAHVEAKQQPERKRR
jgi:hypothetical protein